MVAVWSFVKAARVEILPPKSQASGGEMKSTVPQHSLTFDDDGTGPFPSIPLSELTLLELSFIV